MRITRYLARTKSNSERMVREKPDAFPIYEDVHLIVNILTFQHIYLLYYFERMPVLHLQFAEGPWLS